MHLKTFSPTKLPLAPLPDAGADVRQLATAQAFRHRANPSIDWRASGTSHPDPHCAMVPERLVATTGTDQSA